MSKIKLKKPIGCPLIISIMYVIILLLGIAGISIFTTPIHQSDTILNVIYALESIFESKTILLVLQRLLVSGIILLFITINSKSDAVTTALLVVIFILGIVLMYEARDVAESLSLESLATKEYLISQITNLKATTPTVEAQVYLEKLSSLKIIGNLIIFLTVVGGFIDLLQSKKFSWKNDKVNTLYKIKDVVK